MGMGFVAAPAPTPLKPAHLRQQRGAITLAARGGEYEVTDADIEAFYAETISGSGGDPPKGKVVSELIVKHVYGEFTPQGFKRYSGAWGGGSAPEHPWQERHSGHHAYPERADEEPDVCDERQPMLMRCLTKSTGTSWTNAST